MVLPYLAFHGVSIYVFEDNSGAEAGNITFAVPVKSAPFVGTTWPKDNAGFGHQVYRDFLNREAETGGINYWGNAMDGVTSGLVLIDGFLTSPEHAARF